MTSPELTPWIIADIMWYAAKVPYVGDELQAKAAHIRKSFDRLLQSIIRESQDIDFGVTPKLEVRSGVPIASIPQTAAVAKRLTSQVEVDRSIKTLGLGVAGGAGYYVGLTGEAAQVISIRPPSLEERNVASVNVNILQYGGEVVWPLIGLYTEPVEEMASQVVFGVAGSLATPEGGALVTVLFEVNKYIFAGIELGFALGADIELGVYAGYEFVWS
jgi:hypothetical protein